MGAHGAAGGHDADVVQSFAAVAFVERLEVLIDRHD